jgi:hypothetical protein
LRIVSACSLDPNDDSINQGSQPMKMLERVGAIDVMRAASSSCHSTVERLADLASNHQIVDLSHAQGSKNFFPPRWQRRNKRAKLAGYLVPRSFNIAELQGVQSQIRLRIAASKWHKFIDLNSHDRKSHNARPAGASA